MGRGVAAETFTSRLVWLWATTRNPHITSAAAGFARSTIPVEPASRFQRPATAAMRVTVAKQRGREIRSAVRLELEEKSLCGHTEMNRLKMLVMLTSNWDNKNARDNGSNTAILQRGIGPGRQCLFLVTDCGGSVGKRGNFFTRETVDCEGFRDQTPDFVEKVKDGTVRFGFTGKHDDDFKEGISPSDVRWLIRRLGRVSDAQLRAGLAASGASPHEITCFARALRNRINQLMSVARIQPATRHL
jgi:hypothetical protein